MVFYLEEVLLYRVNVLIFYIFKFVFLNQTITFIAQKLTAILFIFYNFMVYYGFNHFLRYDHCIVVMLEEKSVLLEIHTQLFMNEMICQGFALE